MVRSASSAKKDLRIASAKDGVDPLHDARGDDDLLNNSGLLSGGGFVDDFGLSEVVGDLLLFVVRDEHEEVVKVGSRRSNCPSSRRALRVASALGAANGGRDVVNV